VSSGVTEVGVRRGANGLEFAEMNVILDTTNSILLSELHADSAAAAAGS
jgi:hypothetical protein